MSMRSTNGSDPHRAQIILQQAKAEAGARVEAQGLPVEQIDHDGSLGGLDQRLQQIDRAIQGMRLEHKERRAETSAADVAVVGLAEFAGEQHDVVFKAVDALSARLEVLDGASALLSNTKVVLEGKMAAALADAWARLVTEEGSTRIPTAPLFESVVSGLADRLRNLESITSGGLSSHHVQLKLRIKETLASVMKLQGQRISGASSGELAAELLAFSLAAKESLELGLTTPREVTNALEGLPNLLPVPHPLRAPISEALRPLQELGPKFLDVMNLAPAPLKRTILSALDVSPSEQFDQMHQEERLLTLFMRSDWRGISENTPANAERRTADMIATAMAARPQQTSARIINQFLDPIFKDGVFQSFYSGEITPQTFLPLVKRFGDRSQRLVDKYILEQQSFWTNVKDEWRAL